MDYTQGCGEVLMVPPLARPPARYLMVKSVTVRNFRSFKDVKIDDCRRINIIVGENGSGKTALLEAIFLVAGISPELITRTRGWRAGVEGERFSGTEEDVHRALWADIFHKFETTKTAVVQLRGAGEENRRVQITLHPRGKMKVVAPSRGRPGLPAYVVPQPSPIEFKWTIEGYPDFTSTPRFEGNNLVFPPAPDTRVRGVFFAANRTPANYETVNRFSLLSRTFRDQEFVERFGKLYANIRGLSLEAVAGAPAIYATVDNVPEKIPLGLASGGMSKLASILLSMPEQEGGMILVDELENGLYYKKLSFVWRALLEFSVTYRCQLFVSTHSAECIEAAGELAKESPGDFSIIRTVLESGETAIRQFAGDKFIEALEDRIDVR
jgi:Fe-S cluster assembly ATPase SufC